MKPTMAEYLAGLGTREVNREEELARAIADAKAAAQAALADERASLAKTAYVYNDKGEATPRNRAGKLLRKLSTVLKGYTYKELATIARCSADDVAYIQHALRRRVP